MNRVLAVLFVFAFSFALVVAAGAQFDGTTAVSSDASGGAASFPVGLPTDSGSGQQLAPGQVGGNVGDEVSRLKREMEEKIKAIRAEYQIKINEARKKVQASRQDSRQQLQQQRGRSQQRGLRSGRGQPGRSSSQQGGQFQFNVDQNAIRQNVEQGIRQNVGENIRQNIEGLFNQQGGGFQGSGGVQQQNPIGPTQEQFSPPPSGQSGGFPGPGGSGGSGSFSPSSGSGGGSFLPPPSGGSSGSGGGGQLVPFGSSILGKFLPSYQW